MKKLLTVLMVITGISALADNTALKNAGFESEAAWETIKAHISFSPDGTTRAFEGEKVAFTGGWSGGNGTYLTQLTGMDIKPGVEYVLSAQYAPRGYAGTSFGGVWMRIIANGPGGRHSVALLRSTDPVSTWTAFDLRWTAPNDLTAVPTVHGLTGAPTGQTADISGSKIEILVGQASSASPYEQSYIDAVQLTGPGKNAEPPRKASTAPKTQTGFSPKEIGDYAVPNAGFEQVGAWNTYKAHESFAPDGQTLAKEGAKVGFVGGWAGDKGMFLDQVTDIPVQAGGSYRLSAWFAPRLYPQSKYGGAWLRLIANGPSGRHTVALFRSTDPIDGWTKYALDWVAPADLSSVPVLHGLTGEPTEQTADINGAKLEILLGRDPAGGDAYKQTMIDLVRLRGPGGTAQPPKQNVAAIPLTGEVKKKIATDHIKSIDDLNVSWIQPGRTSKDSMPLGNGETALNVWTLPDGQIVFYIARTDAWSGLGRLLKLGKVHVQFEPNPFEGEFKQTLDLRSGRVVIKGSDGFNAKVWVDANAQTIHVYADADQPFTMTASIELLRKETRPLSGAEAHSAYSMGGGPQELLKVEADTLLPAKNNTVTWYHRNGFSVYPVMMKQQALERVLPYTKDPLLNRTFGCLMKSANLKNVNDWTLKSVLPSKSAHLNVFTHTAITDTPERWQTQIEQQTEKGKPLADAYAAHKKWWNAFWQRSWIFAEGDKPEFYPDNPIFDAVMNHKLRVGADQRGGSGFAGRMARVSIFDYPLNEGQVKSLCEAGRDSFGRFEPSYKHTWDLSAVSDGKIKNKGNIQGIDMTPSGQLSFVIDGARKVAAFDGNTFLQIDHSRSDLRMGGTAEAWIKPSENGGRILDLRVPDVQQGWFLDVDADGSLSGAYRTLQAKAEKALTPGEWAHVALVYDCFHNTIGIYVNGEKVGSDDFMTHHKKDAPPGIWQMNQGYALQRFISACAGRGNFPIKFNGSLFTMAGRTRYLGGTIAHDADYRMWGPDYWFQNTRLPYWPMIASGDFDLMESYWNLYLGTLPMAKVRAKIYYDHGGAYWPETITFWGTFNGRNYGWSGRGDLPDGTSKNTHIRYYFDGALELLAMMLDRYEHAPDEAFFQKKILPFTTEVLKFYDVHYPRDPDGTLRLKPSQAMESYQSVAHKIENPANVIAGLKSVLTRMIEYGGKVQNKAELARWQKLLTDLPPLPVDKKKGVIKVAENYERHRVRGNGEEPGLYSVFPYQLFGVGRPHKDLAMRTFDEIYPPYGTGWNQDHVFAAQLGRTDIAAPLVYQAFTRNQDAGCRFPAFWGPNYDWVPDQDHGGSAQNALQRMLIQSVKNKIHLLPAWPQEWDVNFKLHAAQNTTVEMVVRDGKIEKLDVQPETRTADCVLPDWLGGEREYGKIKQLEAPVRESDADEYAKKKAQIERAAPVKPLTTFLSEEDLPKLRERLNEGRAGKLMQMLRGLADRFMTIETEPYDTDGPYIGRNLQSHVGILGFVGLIDKNPAYMKKGKEILLALVDQNELSDYVKANTHLSVGDAAAAITVAYDWLGSELSGDEQERVRGELKELAEYLYDSSINPHPHPYQKAHNHSVVAHSGLLLAGHILGRTDWVDYATPWVRDFLQEFQDGSGAPYEGVGYSEYGMMMGFMSAEVLRRHYHIDLLDKVAGLEKMPGFLLHHTEPWGGGIIPQNQTGRSVAGATGYYYIINRLKDSAGLYAWELLLGPDGIAELGKMGHDSHFRMFPFLALWTNNDLETINPLQTGEPLFKTYDRGMAAARTAWNDPNAGLITFQSARQTLGVWDHPDENSYTFTALGDNFIIDPGPHIWKGDSHNMILIDGGGFLYRGPGQRAQGTLEEADDRGDSVYLVGDAADAYRLDSFENETGLPVERAERRLLFVRSKEPFLVVVDTLEMKDGDTHDFTLRTVYADSDDKNTAFFLGTKATIIGGRRGTTATMHFLQPASPIFKEVTIEGQNKMAKAFDVKINDQDAAEFLTVITCAPKGADPATIEYRRNKIELTLSNGEEWTVRVTEDDIKADQR